MLFSIGCLFLWILNRYRLGITSLIELVFWSILLILLTVLSLLPENYLQWIRDKLEINYVAIVDSNSDESNKPFERKNDYNLIDAPLEDPKEDQFLRNNFTKGIVHTIANRKDPSSFVIGIYGEWGEGKTSILNFIAKELEKNPEIICVRYNPWRFNDETQLLQNFFFTLADSLGRSLSNNKERIGEWLSKYATILTPLSIGVGGIVELSPGELFSNACKAFSSVELDELKKRIEKILDDEQKKVVVFIDDIDRLDRQEIQMILKIVKLSADFRNTVYVLALDEDMVASALSEKYGTGRISDNENGKKFLEKIIQVPLHLPKINIIVLRNMCFKGIEEYLKKENIQLADEERQQFAYQFNQGFVTKLKTPRLVKRYLNALSFSLPLLKNKINISDLLLIEAIRVFYPTFFLVIRKNPDAFLGSDFNSIRNTDVVKLRYQKIVDSGLEKLDEFDKENLKGTLFTLFPRLNTVYANTIYQSDWDITWDEKQKIASKRHLDRYFAYAFPEGDISEQEVKNFIENMDILSDDQIFEEMQKFVSGRQSADLLLIELRKNLKMIIPDKRKDFAFILSQNSILFPYDRQIFGLSPFEQLAVFLREILLTISDEDERLSFSKSICENSEPVTFGFEFIRWIDAKETDKKIFKEPDFEQLTKILIDRVKGFSTDEIFFLVYPDFASQIFYYWSTYGSKDEIESFLSKTFERDTSNAIAFLKCYLTRAWGANGPVRGNLPRETYNSIIKFCNPSIIYSILEKIYGTELKNANYREDEDIDLDRQIANQFAYLYHHKEEEMISSELTEKRDDTTIETPEMKGIDKVEKIVKYLGKTIFTPIKSKIEEGRDFFERGYNIERYFYEQEILPEKRGKIKDSPNDFLKKMVHDPDIVLKKYLDKIKQMSDEYDNYSKRLEIINSKIFKQKEAIWTEFRRLCDELNQPNKKFPNEERDYLSIFTLTIANAKSVRNAQMYNFFNQHREQLRSFIMQSPLKDLVEEYSNLRDDYMQFSDKFLNVLTNLFREWQRKYDLEESEILTSF